ncbi:glycosyltransferase family 2 protein [Salinisphaera aquimarina]|uniref:Glycosyltransferase family 2 protein n=1 Tax=Salinisphaera aquimarina TaxID=2094031 RepID=A0ABV7ET93_9GAMM
MTHTHAEPTVSVIVATYNRAHYLPECLDSLLSQSRPPDEILVIDDGSDDGTHAVAMEYAANVRYFQQPNQGRPTALNLGIENARGSHLVFFDDDDVLLPDALALHLGVLTTTPGAEYSYGPNLVFDERFPGDSIWQQSRHTARRHRQTATPDDLFLSTLEWGEYFLIYLQGMMIPRRIMEQVGRFQTSLLRGQDYDVMLKLARRYTGVSTQAPTFVMREHSGGRGPAAERHREHERQKMWSKYDRKIVRPYWTSLPLSAYLRDWKGVGDSKTLSAREQVDAILGRSRVMFSHGLFEEAVADIESIACRPVLPDDQWMAAVALVQHAANIEKRHYIGAARALARGIGGGAYNRSRRVALMTAAARGFYWGARRFQRAGDSRAALRLLAATGTLLARRGAAALR